VAVRIIGTLLKADLTRAQRKLDKSFKGAYGKAARVALRTLIDRAPVDEGVLVSNYRVGVGANTPRGQIQAYSPGSKGSTSAINRKAAYAAASARITQADPSKNINIVNTAKHFQYNRDTPGHVDMAIARAAASIAENKVFGR